jgi:hypothetical protein
MDTNYHWANDPYWTEALDKYCELKGKGKKQFVIDLEMLSEVVYDGDGPAYKLMDAMVSVNALEGEDGHRGASRVLLAMLVRLEELSEAKKKRPSR